MPVVSGVRLFDVEPDLTRYLSEEDRATVRQLRMPMVEVDPGPVAVREMLEPLGAFGAIVVEGMILQSMRLGEHDGLRLIGPGDVISLTDVSLSMLVLGSDCRATAPTHLAVLGREFLLASRRWPWLIAGLHARSGEQSERLVTQLMICQLPRVDDRLLSMLWLLSETWGHVTPSGTLLPIDLTHSALGGLVGARRPTVTLALSELTERGAIVRQKSGWLLLEPPKTAVAASDEGVGDPRPLPPGSGVWLVDPLPKDNVSPHLKLTHSELQANIQRLRTDHAERRRKVYQRLQELAQGRQELAAQRARLRNGRSPAPSS